MYDYSDNTKKETEINQSLDIYKIIISIKVRSSSRFLKDTQQVLLHI